MAVSNILAIPLLSTSQSGKETTINTMVNYLERAMNDAVSVDMVNGSLTLPTADFQRYMLFKVVNGSAGSILTVPSIKRLFVLDNRNNANMLRVNIGADTKQIDGGAVVILHSDGALLTVVANSAWSGYDELMPSEEPNGKHAYWRVQFTDVAVANLIEASEIEFRETPFGPDITTGGTAISSGSSFSTTPAMAFDNSTVAFWAQSTSGVKWIGYNFPAPVAITSFVLTYRSAATNYGRGGVVEFSDDGVTWFTGWAFSGFTYTSGVANQKQSTHPRYQKVYDYLKEMSDVLISGTPAEGQVLTYDAAQGKWTPRTLTDDAEAKTHQVWRLFVVANGGGSIIELPEVQFRSVPGTGEVHSGGNPITGNGVAANAFDNNTTTVWWSANVSGNYIGYDFISPKLVEQVYIRGPVQPGNAPSTFRLEYSDDGTTWTTAARVVGKTWTANEVMLVPVGAATQEIPDGGTVGQLLTKRSSADGDVIWQAAPIALPTGGTAGQILTKTSSVDGAATWSDAPDTDYGQYSGDWGGVPEITFDALPSWSWTAPGASIVSLIDVTAGTTNALQFPDIGDSETAQATFSVNMPSAGTMTIRYQTSTDSTDFFKVLVDDTEKASASGISSDWQSVTIALAAGNHIIKLKYITDASTSAGDDTVWISKISFAETAALVYLNGDTVDHDGSLWLCLVEGTNDEPSTSSNDWRILSGSVASLAGLTDVDTTTHAPTEGQALVWNGIDWVPGNVAAEPGSNSLEDLSDVDITTNPPTDGQTIVWDQDQHKWVPGNGASSGGGLSLEGSVVVRRNWRHLRLANIVAQDAASIPTAAEIKFYAVSGDELVPAAVSASSNTPTHTPEAATDNNPDSYWEASDLSPYFTVDFGAVVTVDTIAILSRNDDTSYTGSPKSWVLYGSTDGIEFLELSPMQNDGFAGASSTASATIPTTLGQYKVSLDGVVTLNVSQLADVDLTTAPVAGQALIWDDVDEKWIAGNVASETPELPPITGNALKHLAVNSAGNAVVWVTPDSGGGSAELPPLTGNALKRLAVKSDASGVQWVAETAELPSFTGNAGKHLVVNSSENAAQWVVEGGITLNTRTASYTLVLSDAGKYVRMNVTIANTLIVPPNASVPFPVGTQITIRQAGAGQTSIVAGSGVTVNTADTLNLRKQGSTAALMKVGADEWDLTGDLI